MGAARWGPAPPTPPPPPQFVNLNFAALGLNFDGVGGITSNGECRLLYDYPVQQRSEILDYLFLPSFGLSSTILKVEIGSDAQSTVGTEPAYQHSRGLIAYDRGIQYWFLREAKKRNPLLTIAALEWSVRRIPYYLSCRFEEVECTHACMCCCLLFLFLFFSFFGWGVLGALG